jgi:hypothetical protein
LDLAGGPAPSLLLVLGSARCQLTFAIRMVLQLSAQDIGQLPYFEVRHGFEGRTRWCCCGRIWLLALSVQPSLTNG